MGKSRTVDELSKERLVITVNLRTEGTGESRFGTQKSVLLSPFLAGFPPGDAQVCKFLIREPFDQVDAYKRSHAFFISVFTVLNRFLDGVNIHIHGVSPEDRRKAFARAFRDHMIADQTFEKHGQNRIQFYDDVIKQANAVCCVR
jgi:hypothetical protein